MDGKLMKTKAEKRQYKATVARYKAIGQKKALSVEEYVNALCKRIYDPTKRKQAEKDILFSLRHDYGNLSDVDMSEIFTESGK